MFIIPATQAASVQLDFASIDNTLFTLDGTWGAERNLTKTEVRTGIFAVKSNSGYSSNIHNPFVILCNGATYVAANLIYTGSHSESIEALPIGKSRFLSGLNENVFSWDLLPTTSFTTPEAVITLGKSVDEVSQKMHVFVKENILSRHHQTRKPHVLLNSWEGIFFDFNREKILKLAREAKAIGVDLFVLDDGWFGRRDDDTSSLGDWYDYQSKTGGLKSLVEEIKAIGLNFGLWFEPEMVNKNSDLYRNHPEFAMEIPGIAPIERRHQLMLDFANPQVRDYIFDLMTKVIDDVKPNYLKLDANRVMSDMYTHGLQNHGEYQHRYMLGLLDFWNKLSIRYSDILIEACSSGGNRFDLGTLYYFPQIWASDNTDALARIYIQEGTLLGYPQSTMGTHVSHVPNTTTRKTTPLESRFNVASIGAFGYELDLTKVNQHELSVMKNQIAFYREHSELIFHGHYRRLISAYQKDAYVYMICDTEKNFNQAVVFVALTKPTKQKIRFRVPGISTNANYRVIYRKQDNVNNQTVLYLSGKELQKYVFDLASLYEEEINAINETIASRLIVVERVK